MFELVAVNVVYEIRPGAGRDTAIDKRPVDGPVEVDELGLAATRSATASRRVGAYLSVAVPGTIADEVRRSATRLVQRAGA